MVAQSLAMGQRFINQRGYYPTQKVYVSYPAFMGTEMDNNAFCYTDYNMGTGLMCIGAYNDNWGTMLHEYGHFIQGSLGIFPFSWEDYVSYHAIASWTDLDAGINPNHSGEEDHINDPTDGKGKNIGAKFAWSEGWAEAFSFIVQDYFWTGYYELGQNLVESGIMGATFLSCNSDMRRMWTLEECITDGTTNDTSDKAYRLYQSIDFVDYDSCEGQEVAITTFLCNLYLESYFGIENFWSSSTYGVLTSESILTFSDYANYLIENHYNNSQQIAEIMEKCQLAPGNLQISNFDTHNPPKLSWYVNGGQYTPLDTVRIAFYDNTGEKRYNTDYFSISASNKTIYQMLSPLELEDWQAALTAIGNSSTMRIAVEGFNSTTYLSGPYISKSVEVETPYFFTFEPINNNTAYVVSGVTNLDNWEEVIFPGTYLYKPVVNFKAGLSIDSVGEESESYPFLVKKSNEYNFYHNCNSPISFTLLNENNEVLILKSSWSNSPLLINLQEGHCYRMVIETVENESFRFNVDEVIADELTFETKYYETLNSYSYAYYELTTDQSANTSYTIHSDVVGARTNIYLYDSSYNLVTSSFGDITHQGGKIDYYLAPNTTYTVLVFLISYDYYDDYTIQYYKTNDEVYHLDWGGISKQYFDPILYDYVSFTVLSSCYDLVFDEVTKTITFVRIECFWDVTFEEYPNCPEEYVIGMLIGLTYNSFDSTLPFFSMNGIYQYQAALPYTYSYSATVTNVSITFSDVEWANFVTQGPIV